jgi:triosephosphate isomerase
MPDVDGGLIGRCALLADDFSQICKKASMADQFYLVA